MALDPRIQEAIEVVVANSGQSSTVATKLIRWMEALTSGNEDIQDTQAAERHLEILFEEVSIPKF